MNLLNLLILAPLAAAALVLWLCPARAPAASSPAPQPPAPDPTAASAAPCRVKFLSVILSLLILGLNFALAVLHLRGVDFEFFTSANAVLGYHVGVDFSALSLMLLCSLMIFLAFLFLPAQPRSLVVAIFLLECTIFGLFASLDALLFYIFWELSLLPLLYIMGVFGADFRPGVRFFVYAFAGSLLMLLGLVYFAYLNYELTQIFTFDLRIWQENTHAPSLTSQLVLFVAFFAAFAIKAPLFPLHSWARPVYAHSPVLVGIMLAAFKMAPFGFLRFNLTLLPDAALYFAPLLAALCLVSIIYFALISYRCEDLKELIAYSSLSHVGVMILGLFSFNALGISGALFYMFAHGLVTGAMFLLAQALENRFGHAQISRYARLARLAPGLAIFFFIVLLASVSLPLTLSFVGEFLVLLGIAKLSLAYALLASLIVVLGAVYMLSVYRRIFFMGEVPATPRHKLGRAEWTSLALISALIFGLGLYPRILLDPLQTEGAALIQTMQKRSTLPANVKFLETLKTGPAATTPAAAPAPNSTATSPAAPDPAAATKDKR